MGEQISIADVESDPIDGFDEKATEERAARRTRWLLYGFSFLTTSGLLLLLAWMIISEFSLHPH